MLLTQKIIHCILMRQSLGVEILDLTLYLHHTPQIVLLNIQHPSTTTEAAFERLRAQIAKTDLRKTRVRFKPDYIRFCLFRIRQTTLSITMANHIVYIEMK